MFMNIQSRTRTNFKPLSHICLLTGFLLFGTKDTHAQQNNGVIQMVFTSDAHYGIKRKRFQGDTAVDAHTVNAAMIKQINKIQQVTLPNDNGVAAGEKVGAVDYLIQMGDIANRMEVPYQSAAADWG